MARESRTGRSQGVQTDLHGGRRVALAIEALGEAVAACEGLPVAFQKHAESLAQGRSTVPAGGEVVDFPARLRDFSDGPLDEDDPAACARSLGAWLGEGLVAWVTEAVQKVPAGVSALGLREALCVAAAARLDLLDARRPLADAYASWFCAGAAPSAEKVFRRASTMALGEAVDRWCALGCEGSLDRYIATWQRSAAGWAETVLGTAVEVPTGDLGKLRSLQATLKELRSQRPRSLAQAVASRTGWALAEVDRLLAVEAVVRERLDPRQALRRRWSIVKPVADAVTALEKSLGRTPSVEEIAAQAGVHPATVELVLEAIEDG